ncbi:aromatic ring-hydroxylating dioxygenase subunit alpha [Primorskyibacter aestuariivivens]|uniref:aromatic ring-hydroxylating oxygenase subunit alpha n=1 Tax=Primorskyibacter aestuariivivens TaxID=1888912 RepID=UPI002300C64B|nr:aromatic ring-hydroxylating dioxygenase subunit alpha [Primorskyibacter aestuariivivens]MDA7430177.1 aromatic ring-hydroxylating dioxygenase subunit alpha [Primorskyibacter aestuariivivens]
MTKVTDLSSVRRPLAEANGLPNAHYTDPEVFAEERNALIFSQWAGLAVASDVPEAGDAKPITFLGMPLLLLRGKDDTVRVFQNICRHRGMILVEEARKIEGAIRCPYHSWCYGSDGRLVSTPHVGGPGQNTHDAIKRNELGLIEVRSHIWRDVVWINVSGDAPAFEDAMRPVMERWAEFEKPLYHGGFDSVFSLEVNTNWKLAVENYCESYHLPWVHPGLNSYSRLEDHYNIEEPGQFSGQGTLVYRQVTNENGEPFPDFEGLSNKWDTAAEYISVFPNVLLGVHRDHAFAIVLVPEGPEKTVENIHLYYARPDTDSGLRQRNTQLWKTVFEEDIFVVEGMQRGRHATGFDGGRFSPAMDGPTHIFHDWVASKVETWRASAKAAE